MKDKRQFILDTLLPYKLDSSECAFNSEKKQCLYLTEDGRKCAVGKHLKEGVWQSKVCSVNKLDVHYDLYEILTDEANSYQVDVMEWQSMQEYHDSIATNKGISFINNRVEYLEEATGLDFPELYFE